MMEDALETTYAEMPHPAPADNASQSTSSLVLPDKERPPITAFIQNVMGLYDQALSRQRTYLCQHVGRISDVVQSAERQHHIERPRENPRQVVHISRSQSLEHSSWSYL